MADIQRYLNLVTSQHQDKPKFMAWLTNPLSILDDAVTLANSFYSYFDIDLAIGAQLDILGEILGVSRIVTFQPTAFYNTGVLGVPYLIRPSPVLDDDMYRLILQAKILRNMWDGTLPSLYEIWNILFSDVYLVIKDNQDMTMNVFVIGLSSHIQRDLATNGYLIPNPQGVSTTYSFSSGPLFAFGVERADMQGFGAGTWANMPHSYPVPFAFGVDLQGFGEGTWESGL